MPILQKKYSHVPNFTDYMRIASNLVLRLQGQALSILDMPAGNGLLADELRRHGHRVLCADINAERPDYACVDMEHPLPFPSASFDVVVCLEGIEHVIEPHALVREICRVVKPGGHVVLSLPNVQSLYSRLVFLLTGHPHQFDPRFSRHPRGRQEDRGHISPLTLAQLHYLFGEQGAELVAATGDRIKRKLLLPVYALLWLANLLASRAGLRGVRSRLDPTEGTRDLHTLYRFMRKPRPMMSRSLVTCWRCAGGPAAWTQASARSSTPGG